MVWISWSTGLKKLIRHCPGESNRLHCARKESTHERRVLMTHEKRVLMTHERRVFMKGECSTHFSKARHFRKIIF